MELKEASDKCEVLEKQKQTQVEKISELTKAGEEADTSLSYLLFQALLPMFWTLICMI
jgi:hypothetical protein